MITSGTATTVQFFCENRFSGGFSPNRWNITPLWLFDCPVLSCPVVSFPFFSIHRPGRTVGPIFTLYGSSDVFPRKEVPFGGHDDRWRHLGENMPQNPLKVGVNRQFQAKMPKYENCSISKTVNPIKPKFEEVEFQDGGRLFSQIGSSNFSAVDWDIWSKFGMQIALALPTCGRWPNQKPKVDLWRYGRHLVKSIWHHNSVGDDPICIKFGMPVLNLMPMAAERSKSKPDVEFLSLIHIWRCRRRG